MFLSPQAIVRITAWLAFASVLGLVALHVLTGTGQDALQFLQPPADYARALLRNPSALRTCLALDTFFITFYVTAFVALGVRLVDLGSPRPLVRVVVALLVALGLLDLLENMHFLAMLGRAEQGIVPSATEIELQVMESWIKFHVGYIGQFLLAFALPRRTVIERTLAYLAWFVQLPVGILIAVSPASVVVPLLYARLAYFLVALGLLAIGTDGDDVTSETPDAGCAVGSDVPA